VAIAFTRELGPLITGIMVAARIGAAFTANWAQCRFNEEVEAVEAMGIGPLRFLAAPRNARAVSADAVSLHGFEPCSRICEQPGCKAYFSIAFPYFLDLVKDSLLIRDIITGILKSFMFGLLIARSPATGD
jgi:phospholipid/cholesterol/gamma-HCH transport system permease protein